jgi:hypothetical protein
MRNGGMVLGSFHFELSAHVLTVKLISIVTTALSSQSGLRDSGKVNYMREHCKTDKEIK